MRAWLVGVLLCAGCTSPIVGAACAPGYTACEGACVDVSVDPNHCGACGHVCESEQACEMGVCGGSVDAGAPFDGAIPMPGSDAGHSDGDAAVRLSDAGAPSRDASVGPLDAGGLDAGGGSEACDIGELRCDGRCALPLQDPEHCGGCGISCGTGQSCVDGTCTDSCASPFGPCDSRCVDLRDDPDHCGGCGIACPSGVCAGGLCQEPLAGHLVLVGHDYRSRRAGMSRVAGNAVFLARGNPVETLVFEGFAAPDAIDGTNDAVDQVAAAVGRDWRRTLAASAAEVPLGLADADVFLVYAQRDASTAQVRALAEQWRRALRTFLQRGGVVVVFDGAGDNAGTHRVLSEAGLMTVTGQTEISHSELRVVAPGDAVALGVPLRYRAETSSVRFESREATEVVSDGRGPVVIHRTVVP